jgi:hypothetical protein
VNDDLMINRVLLAAATAGPLQGLSEAQAIAWAASNATAIKLVRDYLDNPAHGLTRPSLVEAEADPNGPLDATLVGQILGLFEMASYFVRVPGA